MAEFTNKKDDKEIVVAKSQTSGSSTVRVRGSLFKYYIHDGIDICRLQLFGELTQAEVPELSGCWRTAKTILGDRKLILDLQRLAAADEAGKQWLVAMTAEGAICQPDSFLRDGFRAQAESPRPVRPSFFARLYSLFRGSRVIPAQSSTQAQ